MLHENDPDAYLSRAREALHRGAWRAALSDATSALGSAIYDSRAWKIKGTPPLSPGTDPPVSPGSDPPASPGSDFSN